MVTKVPCSLGKARVTFSIPAAIWADTIHLVGDFNGWDNTANPLHLEETGWSITLELPAGRSYQYRYLINGKDWHNDWNADRYEPNEFGGDDSVVEVPLFSQAVADNITSSNGRYHEAEVVEFETTLMSPLSNYCSRSAVVVHS